MVKYAALPESELTALITFAESVAKALKMLPGAITYDELVAGLPPHRISVNLGTGIISDLGIDSTPFAILVSTPAPTLPPIAIPGASGPTVTVGTGKQFPTISAALNSFTALGGVILLDGGTYTESFVVNLPTSIHAQGRVTFNWTGQAIKWDSDAQAGIINTADLLLDGGAFGIEMFGAFAQNNPCAAVRPYIGTTTTLRSFIIHDCGDGILTNPTIKALYLYDGDISRCSADDQSHGIYVAAGAGLLHAERCKFHDLLNPGNFVKTRALITDLIDCDIGSLTSISGSKLIDACEGGKVTVKGGTWIKPAGADDSHVLLGYCAENKNAGTPGATITGVTIIANCDNPIVLNWAPTATVAFTGCTFTGNKVLSTGTVGPVTGLAP